MNSQEIFGACSVFIAILSLVFTIYINQKNISNKTIKYIFLTILLLVFVTALYTLCSNLLHTVSQPTINSSMTGQISQREVNLPPVIHSITSDESSPIEAGTTTHWTILASDPNNDTIKYKFLLDGKLETDWSNNPTWAWTTSDANIGSHMIEVKIRDDKHNPDGDNSKSNTFVIVAPSNEPPVVNKLTADKNAPQAVGTIITWTAEAADTDDSKIFYKFFLNRRSTTNWITDNQWIWTTTKANIGNNQIEVQVRDGKHTSPENFDDHTYVNFAIIDSNPVVISNSSTSTGFARTNEYAENGVQPSCEPGDIQVTCSSQDSCVDCSGKCYPPGSYDFGTKICSKGKWILTGYAKTNEYIKNGVEPDCEPESKQAICSSPDSCIDCTGRCWPPGSYNSGKTICSQGKWAISWTEHIYR